MSGLTVAQVLVKFCHVNVIDQLNCVSKQALIVVEWYINKIIIITIIIIYLFTDLSGRFAVIFATLGGCISYQAKNASI